MKQMNASWVRLTVLALIGIILSTCGKKKSSDEENPFGRLVKGIDEEVSASTLSLGIASKLSLIPSQTGATLSLGASEFSLFSATSDYEKDAAKSKSAFRVKLKSLAESVDRLGAILCTIEQTQYLENVGKGAYQAIINQDKCEEKGDGAIGGDANSGFSKKENYTSATILSTREENKPIVVKFWIVDEKGVTQARLVSAEGKNANNPLGIFKLDWSHSAGTQKGTVYTSRSENGAITIAMVINDSRDGVSQGVKFGGELLADPTGSSINISAGKLVGEAKISGSSVNFKVNFNNLYAHESFSSSSETKDNCFDLTSPSVNVFEYGLYKVTDGSRVSLNSNVSLEYKKNSTDVVRGTANYFGTWFENNLSLNHGTQINKVTWLNGNKIETPHTLVKSDGKLVKYTMSSTTLKDLKGLDLRYFDGSAGGQPKQYIVQWNGTKFQSLGEEKISSSGIWEYTAYSTAKDLTASANGNWKFWAPSLQANINIKSTDTFSDSYAIKYPRGVVVNGTSDAPTGNLLCFGRCIKSGLVASDFSGSNMPYFKDASSSWGMGEDSTNVVTPLATYTWDTNAHALKLSGTATAMPSSGVSESNFFANLQTGALITETQWNAISSKSSTSVFDLERLDSFYRYETGISVFSKWTALKDSSGNLVSFDKPLEISYTHSTTNDLNNSSTFDAKKYLFSYLGSGQFSGFPIQKTADQDWSTVVMNIRGGAKAGASNQYVMLPLRGFEQPKKAEATKCETLSFEVLPAVPNESAFTSFDNGTMPAVSSLPILAKDGLATSAN